MKKRGRWDQVQDVEVAPSKKKITATFFDKDDVRCLITKLLT